MIRQRHQPQNMQLCFSEMLKLMASSFTKATCFCIMWDLVKVKQACTVHILHSVQVVTRKICKRFVPTNIQRETTCWQYFIIIIKKLIQEATEFNSFSSSPPSLFSIQSYRSQAREEVPLLWIRFLNYAVHWLIASLRLCVVTHGAEPDSAL